MQGQDLHKLAVASIADFDHIGTVDEVILDLSAQHVEGFSIASGCGPYSGTRAPAPVSLSTPDAGAWAVIPPITMHSIECQSERTESEAYP